GQDAVLAVAVGAGGRAGDARFERPAVLRRPVDLGRPGVAAGARLGDAGTRDGRAVRRGGQDQVAAVAVAARGVFGVDAVAEGVDERGVALLRDVAADEVGLAVAREAAVRVGGLGGVGRVAVEAPRAGFAAAVDAVRQRVGGVGVAR